MFALALLLVQPSARDGQSLVAAERSYAAQAQRDGQWTAFRNNAAVGAIMFAPGPVEAIPFLKGKKDPAAAIKWQPAAAYLSCDGTTGATMGPWQLSAGTGYFATVWKHDRGTWRWAVDFGDGLEKPLPAAPSKVPVVRAACSTADPARLPKLAAVAKSGSGESADHSFEWTWRVEENGSIHILVYLWKGRRYGCVIDKRTTAG